MDLYDSVIHFLDEDARFSQLAELDVRHQVCYLADIFAHLNALNVALQGHENNLIRSQTQVKMFIARLKLWVDEICQQDFSSFPFLYLQTNEISAITKDIAANHLNLLLQSMLDR